MSAPAHYAAAGPGPAWPASTRWTLHGSIVLRWILFCVLALLAACSNEVTLQSGLNDGDANEIITLLRRAGITTEKVKNKDGVSVLVDESELARATELMQAQGLPRRALSHLGQVFKKDGMISSPLEERARYLYGLSQELEYTLSQIDRVVVARVHVVLPERVAPGEPVKPSSASVFIKYVPPLDEDLIVPRIKRLVSTGIPGLSEDAEGSKLSVVMVPAQAVDQGLQWRRVGPFVMEMSSAKDFLRLMTWSIIALVLVAALVAWQWARRLPAVQGLLAARFGRLKTSA
ncbi:type III secretion inner membrane ring lipoprotein SctJ [Ideonella sp. DXS29W]|uniref:Lipoprotein n=1 Tax=Ideonella lacteola TaxID=2984193 RepID=A0ABU9BLI1_9BURK